MKNTTIHHDTVLRVNSDILFKTVGNRTYILEPEKGLLRTLNPTASFVWNLTQKEISFNDIISQTVVAFGCERNIAEKDVREFLVQYVNKGYLVIATTKRPRAKKS